MNQAPEPTWIRVGRIGRVHGVKGEVAVHSPLSIEELEGLRTFIWQGPRGATLPLTLASIRPVHAGVLVSFRGYGDRDRALELVRGELRVEAERLPDPGPETVYTFQLVGLEVRTEEGRLLGRVRDVISTGAHPIYVVQGERELLVPASDPFLRSVDLAGGVITVTLPPGLEEL